MDVGMTGLYLQEWDRLAGGDPSGQIQFAPGDRLMIKSNAYM